MKEPKTKTEVEEEFRASETRYRRLFETAQDGILLLDSETAAITDVNPFLVRMLGYTQEEMVGKKLWEIGPFRDIAASKSAFQTLREGGYIRYEDLPLETKTGEPLEVEFVSNSYVADGKTVIQCNIRDVTAHKRAEAENRRLATAIEQAAEGVMITDLHGAIQYLNPAFTRLTGYTRAEALGHNPRLMMSGVQDLKFFEELWKTISAGEVWRGEIVNRRKDDSLYTESMTVAPVRESDGAITNFIAITQDITERKRAEAEIRDLNQDLERRVRARTAELEAINEELETFTYSVAHDLRAPLRQIQGFAKIIEEDLGSQMEPSAQKPLREIVKGARRMACLIDDLLGLARVGRQELTLQKTGLSPLVEGVVRDLQAETRGREIQWRIGDLPFFECDVGLMRQVFANLLSNAVKYTRSRERAVIEVGQKTVADEAVIFVKDNGVGFNMKHADKLFGVFQRLHRKEEFEGSGVGLAIVQRIVHKHGGRVSAEAKVDHGATFYFTLRSPIEVAKEVR